MCTQNNVKIISNLYFPLKLYFCLVNCEEVLVERVNKKGRKMEMNLNDFVK